MKRTALASIALALLGACSHNELASAGLCVPQETTYFACETHQHKSISICGAAPRALQYRFGTAQRIELAYPQDAAAGTKSFSFAHYFRAQTDRTEITFQSGSVDYAVFDYTEDGKRRAGVRVTTSANKEVEVLCSGRVASRLSDLEAILPCDRDNALSGSACR